MGNSVPSSNTGWGWGAGLCPESSSKDVYNVLILSTLFSLSGSGMWKGCSLETSLWGASCSAHLCNTNASPVLDQSRSQTEAGGHRMYVVGMERETQGQQTGSLWNEALQGAQTGPVPPSLRTRSAFSPAPRRRVLLNIFSH